MYRFLARLTVIVAMLALLTMPSTLAQDVTGRYIIQIRSGTCEAPGDGLTQLQDVIYPSANTVGASEAARAASSYSVAPVSLEALTTSNTAFIVLNGDSNVMVACGEIGGVVGTDGALSIGLRPVGESGISGIAYLAPITANPAQTGVSTFLALTGSAGEIGTAVDSTMGVDAYSSVVSSQLTILVGSLQRIDALFADSDAASSAWTSQVAGELFLWKLLYRVAQDVNPPVELESFNEQYLGALVLLDGAATDIMQALETSDNSLITSGSAKIQEAVTVLRSLQSSQPSATPVPGTPTS